MATVISSSFSIVIDLAAGQTTTNLTRYIDAQRPLGLRGMRVVSLRGTGLNTAVMTLSKVANGGAGAVTAIGVVTIDNTFPTLTDQPGVMNSVADCTLSDAPNPTSGDTLRLVRATADSTRLVIECIAEVGETILES